MDILLVGDGIGSKRRRRRRRREDLPLGWVSMAGRWGMMRGYLPPGTSANGHLLAGFNGQ